MKQQEKINHTYRTMYKEREVGLYWYSGLWAVLRPVLVGLTALLITAGLLLTLWNKLYGEFAAPVGTDPAQVQPFTVESGQSLSRIANNLEQQGLVRNHTVFKYYCDFAGLGQKLQSGSYELSPAMTMSEIANRLTTGDGNPIVTNITLIPGQTIESFAAYLVQRGILADSAEFLSLCRSGKQFSNYYYISDVLADKSASVRKYVLEGYLAPNTYEIYTDAGAADIIAKLLSQTERAFTADMQEVAAEQGYTMDQILTLASLIEKEAGAGDFAKVSAVFHNRLKKGMKLESDVTVHYITGVPKMALGKQDVNVNNPYNTYTNKGLPPGPICNPSVDAIRAALYPDETYVAEGYLYFCATDPESGELHFSRTLAEHEQAVTIYQPLWKAYDEKRGIQ